MECEDCGIQGAPWMFIRSDTKCTSCWLKNQAFDGDNPKCTKCGKRMVMAVDEITKKKSKYLWKWDCECCQKNLRLSIG